MKKFAKLFETKECGQILVVLDDHEGIPSVKFSFVPEGLGVCTQMANYHDEDEDEAWSKAEALFERVDEEKAINAVKPILDHLKQGLS